MKMLIKALIFSAITLCISCKNKDKEIKNDSENLRISVADKEKIIGYIRSKRSKNDPGNAAIDSIIKQIDWEKFKIAHSEGNGELTAIELKQTGSRKILLLVYSIKNTSIILMFNWLQLRMKEATSMNWNL